MSKGNAIRRPDRVGAQRTMYDKNRKRILATQDYCAICGKLVDKSLKKGSDYSPEVDHIIPVAKGGTSDIDNLQLTHRICNRQKSDKVVIDAKPAEHTVEPLAWSVNWAEFAKYGR